MRITRVRRTVVGAHELLDVWLDGALIGQLTLRQGAEAVWLERLLLGQPDAALAELLAAARELARQWRWQPPGDPEDKALGAAEEIEALCRALDDLDPMEADAGTDPPPGD